MSDIAGGMPPTAKPPMGGNDAISQNRSVMNPTDMAAMTQQGTVNPKMTVGDLITKVFKVPLDAPVSALTEAIRRQGQNRTGIGKMGAMANPVGSAQGPRNGQGPQGAMANRMPQGRPGAVPMPSREQGLGDLMR